MFDIDTSLHTALRDSRAAAERRASGSFEPAFLSELNTRTASLFPTAGGDRGKHMALAMAATAVVREHNASHR